jgi:peroxiredoxin
MKTQLIAAVAAVAIGAGIYASPKRAEAPQATFVTLSGKHFTTADLRGKVVLVNFWATWCSDCVKEMPKMADTYRKFAPRGYEMVAVALQADHPNQVAAFTRSRALPFEVALDLDGAVAKSFGNVHITPSSFLIDKDGRIIRKYVGEPDWTDLAAAIERALGA